VSDPCETIVGTYTARDSIAFANRGRCGEAAVPWREARRLLYADITVSKTERTPTAWIATMLGAAVVAASASAHAQAQAAATSSAAPDDTTVASASSTAPSSVASDAPFAAGIDTPPVELLRVQPVLTHVVGTEGSAIRTGYAATIVHRPVAQVIAAIHDVNHYRDFIPQFEQSQELSHGVSSQDFFLRVEIRHFAHIWARLRYHESTTPAGAVEIEGHALQGNVARMDVRWRATPIENGTATVLEFWSLVVPSLPIPLPTSLIEREQEFAAQRGVTAVRARVESEEVRVSSAGR
jgi:ribosome-associated toxin RatA of RatAB toxin-antitoxin module